MLSIRQVRLFVIDFLCEVMALRNLNCYFQVGLICERLLKEQEERLCLEYEKALVNKLSGTYTQKLMV